MTAHRILIIEDDPALLRGLKDNFAAAGYGVRTAADGQRGLDALLAAGAFAPLSPPTITQLT